MEAVQSLEQPIEVGQSAEDSCSTNDCGGVLRPLSFAPDAIELAKEQLKRRGTPDAFIRIGVAGGGCAGFQYHLSFDDGEPSKRDRVLERGGVRFIVDRKSLIVLTGSILTTEQSGLMGRSFSFQNPRATSTCSCGKSFSI